FIKLLAKEVIVPDACDKGLFLSLPFFAVAAVATSVLMIPVWGANAVFPFPGDLIVVIYLLTIPTVTFFLAGWSSTSPYAAIGSIRVLTQLFAYEVPLMLAVLGPAILAGSVKIQEIAAFYSAHPLLILVNLPALLIALVALQGKLERVPFDIPHGETEIVGGAFTEYSGRLLGFMLLATDMEMVVGAALISAVFLGGALGLGGIGGFAAFVVKALLVVLLLASLKALMARIRIEQMIKFCWQILAPAALLQLALDIFVKSRM
ncbi:MAG: NADH-quinone oxidoreductase subunit H, partial [Elusimicrobiales bacterium]|nr:NADH-quinone oxidoreductase subunit H [Elusimicrobiales bacterium]